MIRSPISGLIALLVLSVGCALSASEYHSHPTWGNEELWGYWEFDNDYLPKQHWKIVSVSKEGDSGRTAANMINDRTDTYYYAKDSDVYDIVIDLGESQDIGALSILTMNRPEDNVDSMMAKFELFVGDSPQDGGTRAAGGEFNGQVGTETVIPLAQPVKGRYVKLRAFSRATKALCIHKINFISPEMLKSYAQATSLAAEQRKAGWANRNSNETISAFGKEFMDLISMWGRPMLDNAYRFKNDGKFPEALKAFRDYYFDKLRRPQEYGLIASDTSPNGHGVAGMGEFPQAPFPKDLDDNGKKHQIELADGLMKGIMGDGKVAIGEPGSVDWMAPGGPYGWSRNAHAREPYRELYLGEGFKPLWVAFMMTKKSDYLERWLEYMDDWALNCTVLGDLNPCVSSDNQLYPVVNTIRMFGGIAQSLPFDSDLVKPQIFARIMRKMALESPLNYTVYYRSNCNAWTPGGNQMLLSMLIDEFTVAQVYFRETLRRNIEDINAIQMLRDGTDPHQWFGYNAVVLSNAAVFRLMNGREGVFWFDHPSWESRMHDPAWQVEERELLGRRCKWITRWAAPNGDYPNITMFGSSQKTKTLEQTGRLPSQMNDPVNLKMFEMFYGNDRGPDLKFTADYFPYSGFSIARTGWGEGQGYGAMFCSPQPGLNSASKNNVFGLNAYGMDLMSDDIAHNYHRRSSPIMVDGRPQDIDFYVPKVGWPTGHRGEMIKSWTDPAPWRWHATDQFNVMEGVYSGAYSNDFSKRTEAVKDVRHQRLAMFARHAGMWIITDRMLTPAKHDYEQLWWLALKSPNRDYGGFDHDGIVFDAASRSIKTRRTRTDKRDGDVSGQKIIVGNVNLSMYQFTDAAIGYDHSEVDARDEFYNWEKVSVSWKGEGDQQIVTALFPRKPTPNIAKPDGTENDLTSIKALSGPAGTAGFQAITPEGVHVSYLAAKGKGATLEIEGVRIFGEALLISRDPAEKVIRGMAFGCTSLVLKGKPRGITHTDFEFSFPEQQNAPTFIPVYRPMAPVRILPETDVFADKQEITLACGTPGAVMTYTLDGSEPTPQSYVYKGPFIIDRSYEIKARAYRPGTTVNPPDMSGTQATAMSYAVYTRQRYDEPETGTGQKPGLNYEYCDGYWKDLWLFPAKQTPKKKGEVTTLFDMTQIPDDNKPLGDAIVPREKAYSFTYTGFLSVPEDGTYTVHAPREFVHPDQIAGYELEVYLGHATVLNQDKPEGVSRDGALSFWYPSTRLHALGTWSVPLKKGMHELKIVYIDFRMDGPRRLNNRFDDTSLPDCVWTGDKPALLISGPHLKPQPIPESMLWH